MGLLQHAYRPAMGSVLVGQQDELAPQSLAQQGQELNHLLKRDIPVMDAKAQPEVLPLLGRRDPRDHRQPVVLIPRSAWAADPDAAWLAGPPPLLPPVPASSAKLWQEQPPAGEQPHESLCLVATTSRRSSGASPVLLRCLLSSWPRAYLHVVTVAARGPIRPSAPDMKGPGQRADVFQRCLSTVGSSRATYMTLWSAIPQAWCPAAPWKLGTR